MESALGYPKNSRKKRSFRMGVLVMLELKPCFWTVSSCRQHQSSLTGMQNTRKVTKVITLGHKFAIRDSLSFCIAFNFS